MREFFILEGAYIVLGLFILAITLFITTRPFMKKGSVKRGFAFVSLILVIFIGGHFFITKKRIDNVKKAFNANKKILCENRVYTKGAQFITIKKDYNWSIDGYTFKSPNYSRTFHIARCIVEK